MGYRDDSVHIQGGTISGDAVAIGAKARAEVNRTGETLRASHRDEVADRLAALEQELQAHKDRLPDRELVLETVATLAEALRAERPNRVTVKSLLAGIAEHVRAVGGLVEATRALGEAVSRLW
jgi:hypothetical protein